ncbi:MAG: restriction endonuclease [Gammaproteobacteria bacterium]|nr:restriction endonuclease [Gammaproteobacteria bacterium]MDH5654114.1 restriction endonuclease [Gammaproteobacteria bacterium]
MSDKRSDIAKLIEKIHVNQKLMDQLRPPVFESVVAEIFSQNQALIEVQRNMAERLDFVGKFRDELNHINSFAVEVKKLDTLVDTSAIRQFQNSIASLGIDKGYFVTTSAFSEAAKAIAAQHQETLKLIDRTTLTSLINQYTINRDIFAENLFQKAWSLELDNLAIIANPSPTDIEEFDIGAHNLGEEEKSTLISVDSLPLKLIAKIMRSPSEVKNLTPRQFEEFVAETLSQLGFSDVILTPRSGDGGKDVIASHLINGIPLSFYFECKKYADGNKIQLETLRALLGTMAHDARHVNKGVLVTTSTFTKGSKEFIIAESRLDGKDYDGILGWIDELNKKM